MISFHRNFVAWLNLKMIRSNFRSGCRWMIPCRQRISNSLNNMRTQPAEFVQVNSWSVWNVNKFSKVIFPHIFICKWLRWEEWAENRAEERLTRQVERFKTIFDWNMIEIKEAFSFISKVILAENKNLFAGGRRKDLFFFKFSFTRGNREIMNEKKILPIKLSDWFCDSSFSKSLFTEFLLSWNSNCYAISSL